jgi:CHASE1-domain containing sensor protein/nitrogen-specific signal transduction histidine kinase
MTAEEELERRPEDGRRRALWILPVVVFIAGVTLTGVLYFAAQKVIHLRDQARFNTDIRLVEGSLKARLEIYIGLLRAGAGFFAAHRNVDETAFHQFTERINPAKNYPGVQAIGFAQRVQPHEMQDFTAEVRASGHSNFSIKPDGDRDEYYVIKHIEPMDRRNEKALGYDMFSEPVRRAAMERARDERAPRASGRVTLVQEIDEEKQAGFLIYVPIYRGPGLPESVEERRRQITGFIYSPFRMNDLLRGIFGEEQLSDIHIEIFDGEVLDQQQALFRLASPVPNRPTLESTSKLDIAGRTWLVRYRTTPAFDAASPRSWTIWVAAAGVIVSASMATILLALVRAEAQSHKRALELRVAADRYRKLGEQQEQLVLERTAELRETNSQLEAFVYSIAHDLRAPLRAMSGYAYLLEQDAGDKLNEESRRRLGKMKESAALMDRLILDLIAFGRTARAEMELSPVDTEKALQHALAQTSAQRDESRAEVNVIGKLPVVIAHEATLTQALANLVANAMKFVAPGVTPRVTIRHEDAGDRAKVWIEDNGIGIPPNMQERAFRLFERLHGAQYGGTGIGLSIVRKGVERMGGRVGVVSDVGVGSRFWIDLKKA